MKRSHDSQYYGNLAVAIVISLLAMFIALPTLVPAWRVDLYARGGQAAFGIWLVMLVVVFLLNRKMARHPARWTLAAALMLAAGSICDLRVLDHAGLALAFTGVAGFRFTGAASAAAALSWLPAAGWFISRFRAGGLLGWERPVIAVICAAVVIAAVHIKNTRFT